MLEQQNDPASGDVDNKKLMDPAVRAILQTKERDSPPLQNLNSPINQSTGVKLQGIQHSDTILLSC